MTFDSLQRAFVDLIGGSESGGNTPDPAKAEEDNYRRKRAAAMTAIEAFNALPGGPRPAFRRFLGDVENATLLAGGGNFKGAAEQLAGIRSKVLKDAEAVRADPSVKGYQEKLAEATRLETEIGGLLGELQGASVSALLEKPITPVLDKKKATEDAAATQPAATSLKSMAAVAEQLKPLRDEVRKTVLAKRAYDAVAVPARRTLGIVKATPRSTWTNLDKQFGEAEALAKSGDFVAAKAGMAGFDEEARRQLELADEMQQKVNGQLEHQPVFEARLAKAEALLANIKGLPGIRESIASVEASIAAARGKASQSDYNAAIKALDAIKDGTEADCRKRSEAAQAGLAKNPEFTALRKEALAAAAGLADVAQPPELADARGDVAMLIDRIVSGIAPEVNLRALAALAARLRQRGEALLAMKAACEKSLQMANGNIGPLKSLGGAEAAAPFEMRLDRLKTAAGLRRYEEVTALAAELDRETVEAARLANVAAKAWEARKAEVARLMAACDTMALCPPAAAEAMRVKSSLGALGEVASGDNRNPEAAISRLDALKASAAALQTNVVDKFAAVEGERDAADKRVDAKAKQVDAALSALEKAVATARKGEPDPEAGKAPLRFVAELQAIKDRWKALKASALIAGDLKEPEVIGALDTLKSAIDAGALPDGVKATAAAQKQDESALAFEAQWTLVSAALKTLQTLDVAEGDLAYDRAQALRNEAPADYTAALPKLAALKNDLAQREAAAQIRLTDAAAKARELGDKVLEEIDALKEVAKSELFDPMFDDMTKQHEATMLSAASKNADTVAEAEADLRQLQKRIAGLRAKIGAAGPDIDNFKGVEDKIADIKKQLEKEELKSFVPSQLERINETLKTTLKTLPAKTPVDAMVDLRNLQAQLTGAFDAAGVAKRKRKSFDDNTKLLQAKIKQLDAALAYTKALKPRLEALKTTSRTEGGEDPALAKLDALDKEVSAAAADPAVAQAHEVETRAADLKKEQDKIVWASSLKTFKNVELPQAERAVAGDGDATLVAELNRLVKSAESVAKGGDHAEANRQLEQARQRVKQIVANPFGATIGSRNELPKDNAVFKQAVQKFNAAVLAFPEGVKKAAGGSLDKPAEAKLVQLMKTLSLSFRADAFDASVQLLSAKETEKKRRRAERESALSQVRSLQASLARNPLLASLSTNPIDSAQIQPAMSGMYYALNRLEGNLMRCCN
jgi:hypothetical protein